MDLGIAGKRAFVAASTSGLGLAVACSLAAEGALVAINGRRADRVEEALRLLPGHGRMVVGDVAARGSAAKAIDTARAALEGEIDILVLNGPGPPPRTFGSSTADEYEDAVDAGLMPAIEMCSKVIPGMCDRGWGRVVAITSISVRQPIGNLILSTVARAGLTGFLKTLATEVAPHGVTVNSLQPGLHSTPRVTEVFRDRLDAAVAAIPVGKLGDPEEFGRLACFLCSVDASFVTGAAIPVDGGGYGGLL